MAYVEVAPGGRYFMTTDGKPFLAIGHNDAMVWPTLLCMHYEQDLASVEAYIKMLAEHGVTVLRIMLEYCQDDEWYFENPVGQPLPEAVLYWDDLIGLCECYGVRLLISFWDTFFMSRRWEHHPYSKGSSGFDGPGSFCTSPSAFEAQKGRISFFIERWGNSPAIFAYDLLNEIHPYWGGTPEEQHRWVGEMARFVKGYEMERWGKRHLLTVSIFGSKPENGYDELILRHPELDFASTHVYEFGLVDNPDNSIDCAVVMSDAVKFALEQMPVRRPFTDSESGPIHLFMDLHRQLEEPFESEYYHNMSWAHLATGGAGSGMRWPFRVPHCLTPEMHLVQRGMSRFAAACNLDWLTFAPELGGHLLGLRNRSDASATAASVLLFGCLDGTQALVWLLRDSRIALDPESVDLDLCIERMEPGQYIAEFWETYSGEKLGEVVCCSVGSLTSPVQVGTASLIAASLRDVQPTGGATLRIALPSFTLDLAVTIKLQSSGQGRSL